jgi:hypothetical protein
MVDAGIKKVKIPFEEFPLVQFTTTKIAATISNISGNGTTITYTTTSPHNFLPGQRVKILQVLPTVYNLDGALINAVPNTTTFTVLNSASATYISGGTVEIGSVLNNVFTAINYVDELYYDFRYRIVSEDKNRFSHWSSIERNIQPDVSTPFPYTAANRISISTVGNPVIITATWTKPEERSFTISNVSGNGTLITYTTDLVHGLIPGNTVDISGVLPTTYNLVGATVNTVPTTKTFTVLSNISTTYVSGGTVTQKLTNLEKFINRITSYDIWVRWSNDNTPNNESDWEPWQYITRVSTNSFSIAKRDASVKYIDFAIQVPTDVKLRDYYDNKLTMFRKSHAV